ncbi:MAG: hypothetical protein D6714_08190 [Bacteroidetes bacterium]|nr:MAG: hypothetical protein D6714_08190 [Bacteroidota bacterium]
MFPEFASDSRQKKVLEIQFLILLVNPGQETPVSLEIMPGKITRGKYCDPDFSGNALFSG